MRPIENCVKATGSTNFQCRCLGKLSLITFNKHEDIPTLVPVQQFYNYFWKLINISKICTNSQNEKHKEKQNWKNLRNKFEFGDGVWIGDESQATSTLYNWLNICWSGFICQVAKYPKYYHAWQKGRKCIENCYNGNISKIKILIEVFT